MDLHLVNLNVPYVLIRGFLLHKRLTLFFTSTNFSTSNITIASLTIVLLTPNFSEISRSVGVCLQCYKFLEKYLVLAIDRFGYMFYLLYFPYFSLNWYSNFLFFDTAHKNRYLVFQKSFYVS